MTTEQQQNKRETRQALEAFNQYILLGPGRSLRKLAEQQAGEKPSRVRSLKRQYERWSSEHQWQQRAAEYEAELAHERRLKKEAEREAMEERHAIIGVTSQKKAIEQIDALIAAQAFGSMAAVQVLRLGLDTERTARGVPTDLSAVEVTGKNGAPLPGIVAIYLPAKNPAPVQHQSSEEEEEAEHAP